MTQPTNPKGICYLVGSGPGDLGLVTLRAKECVEMADIVLYDYLCNPEILNWARPDAEIIYVGKKAADHTIPQDQLNALLVEKSSQGKIVARLKGGDPYGPFDEPFLVSEKTARIQTLAAAMLTNILDGEKLSGGRTAEEVWERIYAVTAFYVGLADDLGFQEYRSALAAAADGAVDPGFLTKKENRRKLLLELARHNAPAIYGGTGEQVAATGLEDPNKLIQALDKSMGFRLMGQRFVVDSYAMGKLVFPTVGRPTGGTDMFTCTRGPNGPYRGFPRGLDVMALLGSKRAREILTELRDDAYGRNDKGTDLKYQVVFDRLKGEFDELSESDWTRNVYWSWLHALKPMLNQFGRGYPTFMRTRAWHDKSLTAALASWAQLRHDTILYAKQSYTVQYGGVGPRRRPVEGYVEPVPEFYARMLALTQMTRTGLRDMNVLDGPAVERLTALERIIARLLTISQKELAHKELTKEDYAFIRSFGQRLEGISVKYPGKDNRQRREDVKRAMMTTVIADVHTDQNSKKVLEEATGQVELLVVCYLQSDGRLVLGAGPVLSYYEFKHPMADRLTDEKWVEMLNSGRAPKRPRWARRYLRE